MRKKKVNQFTIWEIFIFNCCPWWRWINQNFFQFSALVKCFCSNWSYRRRNCDFLKRAAFAECSIRNDFQWRRLFKENRLQLIALTKCVLLKFFNVLSKLDVSYIRFSLENVIFLMNFGDWILVLCLNLALRVCEEWIKLDLLVIILYYTFHNFI